MQRGPFGGRSKATASTTCQKCLKKDIYECTVSAQERPYKSRPSRTQQLLNPKLKPKLTTEVPSDLLRKKGVADEILAKKENERGRRSSRDDNKSKSSRKESRSVSSDSVSTISTNRSPSRSPSPKHRERSKLPSSRGGDSFKKRGRAESEDSVSSSQSYDRNMRRRLSSFSPQERGRRSRSHSDRMEMSQDLDTILKSGLKRFSRSRSSGRGRGRGRGRRTSRSRSGDRYGKRPVRRVSLSRSPSRNPDRMDMSEERQPHRRNGVDKRELAATRRASPSQSRSRSRVRGRIPRSSRSPHNGYRSQSPLPRRGPPRSPSPFRPRNGDSYRNGPTGGRARPFEGRRSEQEPNPGSHPQRERSLSPYSKRVAMTRQMQPGR